MADKTAIIKVYVKGEAIGKVQGEPGIVYPHTPELLESVIELINQDRLKDGLEKLRPSQTVGAQMLISYC